MALTMGVLHETKRQAPLQTLTVTMIKDMFGTGAMGYRTELRIVGKDGHWYRVRVSGQLRTWKRDLHRVELPVKYGMYENITLRSHDFDSGRVAVVA